MKKFIYSFLIGGAALLAYSCEQEFGATELATQKAATLKLGEMGKYSYETVIVPHNAFSTAASRLLNEEGKEIFNNSFGSTGAGAKVNIKGVTNAKADLGRVLFYDPKLSLNNATACASCHNQKLAFADGKQFSQGFEGRVTSRNSMCIVNPAMSNGLFWDERSPNLRDLALKPVQNHIEMGMESMALLEKKLGAVEYYPDLFAKAYGTPIVTEAKIAEAMTAFLRSFVSWDSKYDQAMAEVKTNGGFGSDNLSKTFSVEEEAGRKLFMDWNGANCASCHNQPTFDKQWGDATNIGLDKVSKDPGKSSGRFKVPSLRNVEMTGPYMHDGRFKTLEEVVKHYNEGVQFNSELDWNLRDGNSAKKLNLTDSQQKSLVAFLKTLTDKKFIEDPKFSDPFQR